MSARTNRKYLIRRREQFEALASLARQEVVEGVEAVGPCTISELAELLGRAPDSLYYHVRKLEKVGLLVRHGQTKAGRRDADLYDVPGRPMSFDETAFKPAVRPLLIRAYQAMLRASERELREALETGVEIGRGRRRRLWGGRLKGRLSVKDIEAVNRHVDAIVEIFGHSISNPRGELFTLTYGFTPVSPSPRADD